MSRRFLSVCSGIEAASVAWSPLGWHAAALAEIAPFPRAVLSHHYPEVPLLGDFTSITREAVDDLGPVSVLCGGTPCQSFSVAGLRKGMDDPRGNLALAFLRLADLTRPGWVVWENVPGVLSSNGGRDFGAFLGALGQLGYGWAYRVLDAQYFGVPQRRRRVFVVGCAGGWATAAAVLFERHSLSGHPAPSRAAGKRIAASPADCTGSGSIFRQTGAGWWTEGLAGLRASPGGIPENVIVPPAVAHTLRGEGFDASEDGTGRGTPLVPVAVSLGFIPKAGAGAGSVGERVEQAPTITTQMNGQGVQRGTAVRRLTPVECERLQGFPDDYTRIPYRGKPADKCPDGPRYRALGNSWAVPVARWIGERIDAVDAILAAPQEVAA